jgi:hypothetical protein
MFAEISKQPILRKKTKPVPDSKMRQIQDYTRLRDKPTVPHFCPKYFHIPWTNVSINGIPACKANNFQQ